MFMKKSKKITEDTTFSIEVFVSGDTKANANGVHPANIVREVKSCLHKIRLIQLFEDEGIDIQIRREDL